jgi:hypothetical protein
MLITKNPPPLGFFPNQRKTETVSNPHLKIGQSEIIREVNGKQYTILIDRMTPFTPIRLENGEWAGVIYHYGRTRLLEEDNHVRLSFEYYIVENPGALKTADSQRFLQYIGDILVDIMEYNLNESVSSIPIMSQNEIQYL